LVSRPEESPNSLLCRPHKGDSKSHTNIQVIKTQRGIEDLAQYAIIALQYSKEE
ncbi:17974_t:CDS:1, partial [Gigaspora rosea]